MKGKKHWQKSNNIKTANKINAEHSKSKMIYRNKHTKKKLVEKLNQIWKKIVKSKCSNKYKKCFKNKYSKEIKNHNMLEYSKITEIMKKITSSNIKIK
ncbi:hypothetical protein FK515_28550 [Klebsiella pneumoniae]|nr:hypothetical protein [Klebsiella pneumoniae]